MTSGKTTCRVRFEPSGLKTEVPRGATLLEAARLAGVYLTSVCGGDGTCGKCRVVVASGDVEALPRPRRRARATAPCWPARPASGATSR